MKDENKGQGKAGGKINAPSNIPEKQGGTPFGRPATINAHASPKETKESGIDGAGTGSNKSSFVF